MGFRQGSYATIWSIEQVSPTFTKGRISISRKNKQTDQYETDFSGYVAFCGTLAAGKAAKLNERDRIKLGDVDVSTTYNKETKVQYTDFKVFSFDVVESSMASPNQGEVDDSFMDVPCDGDETPLPY